MKSVVRVFLRGLFTVLPLAVTGAVIWWLFDSIESLLRVFLEPLLADRYFPGLGLLCGVLLVALVGVIMGLGVARWMWRQVEKIILRIPVVKTVYSSVQDMLGLFGGNNKQGFSKVVVVRFGEHRVLGFTTREAFDDLPAGIGGASDVAVYLPMSYQLGGYTVMTSRDHVEPIHMSMEDAMKFVLTAGVKKGQPADLDQR